MKKILLSLLIALLPLALPASVSAVFDPLKTACEGITDAAACEADGSNPVSGADGALTRVINLVSWVVGVASVIVIIYSGIKFATAQGNSEGVGTARTAIIYAAIGLGVAASAQIIIRFVIEQT